jgi:hypothetical protein
MSKDKLKKHNYTQVSNISKQLDIPFNQTAAQNILTLSAKVVRMDTFTNRRNLDLINQIIATTKSF